MRTKKSSNSPVRRILIGFAYVTLLSFALLAGTFAGWARRSSFMRRLPSAIFSPPTPAKVFPKQDGLTVLLLGCDEDRFYHGTYANGSNIRRKYARADMILVARLDFKNNRITGVSIPRDTECDLPGYGRHKINAFHARAPRGQEDHVEELAVEHLLPGVDVQKVLVIDYDAFQSLVNLVGGVDVVSDRKMDYDDNAGELHIHINKGPQHLDGKSAMGFVRFRHDRESDFGRQARQKQFLVSFKSAVFRNWQALPEVAEQGKVVLNNRLTDDEILAIASFGRSVRPEDIQMGMLPVIERSRSRLVVDDAKRDSVLRQYGLIPGIEIPRPNKP